jgi:hypothetical protein
MAISPSVVPQEITPRRPVTLVSGGAWMSPAQLLARSLVMVGVAAFAILVLLPAAVAAQRAIPV